MQYEFKAEIKQLLDILINSLYSDKEIFLRELISNSSDALDKLRFQLSKGTEIEDPELPLEIRITFDEKAGKIFLSDTGIGMTEDELVSNLGTIAHSGSSEFLKELQDKPSDALGIIGKFGVGFYSVFMVASRVTLKTKSYTKGSKSLVWTSDGLGSYDTYESEEAFKRGAALEIDLKDDAKEFADKIRLENIIKTHSNFISFPIFLDGQRKNTMEAIWAAQKSSLTEEKYDEFYKFLTYDQDKPFTYLHKAVDAPIQFSSLLYIPKKSDEMWMYDRENYGLDLYVRRVLIQHKCKNILPEYLSFVKGVVDSEDLPLNISRETLQENVIFNKISSAVTSQLLQHLEKIAKDEPERYAEFWKVHGKVFKMGYMDFSQREKFFELLRFNSSVLDDESSLTSLNDYLGRMKEDQKEIYYLSGQSRAALLQDPHYEIFKAKGIEVLFLMDPVDEFVVSALGKYKEHELKGAEEADLKTLDKIKDVDEKKDKPESLTKDEELQFSSLLSKMKEILGDKVTEVRQSQRLQDSPACLISADGQMSSSMQKMMKMVNKDNSVPKKIMEVNKDSVLIRNLIAIFKSDPLDSYIAEVTEQLYDSSLLMEGLLNDPYVLISRINSILQESSSWYAKLKENK